MFKEVFLTFKSNSKNAPVFLSFFFRGGDRTRIHPRQALRIFPSEKADVGVYQCEASSGGSYASGAAYVSLGGKFIGPGGRSVQFLKKFENFSDSLKKFR